MKMNKKYKMTLYACYLAYVVQGIINNINPILFANYQRSLGITVDKIGILIAVNFVTQIIIDFASVGFVDRIGYRKCMVLANACSVLGLLGVGIFPFWFGDPMLGLTAATVCSGIGGGLLEVLVSPIVEAVPTDNKEKSMSMLHSFYCWGCVGFIAVSTMILFVLGEQGWHYLPFVWVIVPLVCGILFCRVPVRRLVEEEERIPVKSLAGQKIFWCLLVLMICAGASEMGMSQWTSYFAEMGLHVNKAVGDLLGACSFCVLMGLARLYYGKSSGDLPIRKFMAGSYVLCMFSYGLTVFAPPSAAGASGVCPVWIVGGSAVAGYIQHSGAGVQGGRNSAVCPAGTGGGYWMCLWSGSSQPSGRYLSPVRGKGRTFRSNSISRWGAAADGVLPRIP